MTGVRAEAGATLDRDPQDPAAFPSFVDRLPITRRALAFAATRHAGQHRQSDHAPFILHPLEVAQLLNGRAYPDRMVAAGVLHEVIEDGHATAEEIGARFGPAVETLVRLVTDPVTGGDWPDRKRLLRDAIERAPHDAAVVFAADKVAKVRELRMQLATGHLSAASRPTLEEKLEHYRASLDLLERKLGMHPFVEQLRFELEALELLPPAP